MCEKWNLDSELRNGKGILGFKERLRLRFVFRSMRKNRPPAPMANTRAAGTARAAKCG